MYQKEGLPQLLLLLLQLTRLLPGVLVYIISALRSRIYITYIYVCVCSTILNSTALLFFMFIIILLSGAIKEPVTNLVKSLGSVQFTTILTYI